MAKIMDQFRQHKKQTSVDTVATKWPASPSRSSTTAVSPPSSTGTDFPHNRISRPEVEKPLPSYPLPILGPPESEAQTGTEDDEDFGEAVALFDFERDSDNLDELPLSRGQIVDVLCSRGQGWLLAQNPSTQECGLVPQEFVRLVRDYQGGLMLYDFEQQYDDEMSLARGQIIWATCRHGQGWLEAENPTTMERGLVPERYVRRLTDDENSEYPPQHEPPWTVLTAGEPGKTLTNCFSRRATTLRFSCM